MCRCDQWWKAGLSRQRKEKLFISSSYFFGLEGVASNRPLDRAQGFEASSPAHIFELKAGSTSYIQSEILWMIFLYPLKLMWCFWYNNSEMFSYIPSDVSTIVIRVLIFLLMSTSNQHHSCLKHQWVIAQSVCVTAAKTNMACSRVVGFSSINHPSLEAAPFSNLHYDLLLSLLSVLLRSSQQVQR